jgi:hypothetical protein
MNATFGSSRWSGIAFMLGSILFLVNKLDEMSRLFLSRRMPDVISGQDTLLILIGQIAFIIGYVGFWQLYSGRVSRWGKVALRLFTIGGIILALGHATFMSSLADSLPTSLQPAAEALFVLVLVGMLLLVSGLIWFGVLNLRQRVLVRWQWLPLATGLMGFAGFFLFSGADIGAVFLLFRTLFALGLFGLGLLMWSEKPATLILPEQRADGSIAR